MYFSFCSVNTVFLLGFIPIHLFVFACHTLLYFELIYILKSIGCNKVILTLNLTTYIKYFFSHVFVA